MTTQSWWQHKSKQNQCGSLIKQRSFEKTRHKWMAKRTITTANNDAKVKAKPTTTPATLCKEIEPVVTKKINLSQWFYKESDKQHACNKENKLSRMWHTMTSWVNAISKKMAISLFCTDQHLVSFQVFPMQEEVIMSLVSVKKTVVNLANLLALSSSWA